jgi:RNA polymerase sigma factor (sigma-70 family)
MTAQAVAPHSGGGARGGERVAGSEITDYVLAASNGSRSAWNSLVQHYAPLVRSVARSYRLAPSDVDDVSQTVWLRLFETLDQLRDPRALPGWLKTTTQREALLCLAKRRHTQLLDPSTIEAWLDPRPTGLHVDDDLLRREADQAVNAGLAELSPRHRSLLVMLHAEPQHSYQEISRALGMAAGSIGPTRARCIDKLRRTEAIRAFLRSTGTPAAFANA